MFSAEIKFARDQLIKWFNKKFKSENLELGNDVKRRYEIKNPVDWIEGCYCICKFPLKFNLTILTQQRNAAFVFFK